MKTKEINKQKVAQWLGDALRHQINYKRSEKDLEIVNKYKEEARENMILDKMNQEFNKQEINKKTHQRDELRIEIARVLEAKRQQKLRQQEEEFKYYL